MDMFSDKVAIITGAGSGIGRGLAKALAGRGARLVLADIREDRAAGAANALVRACSSAEAHVLDVSDFDSVRKLVEGTVRRHGRLDYLFNNAGIAVGAEVRDCPIEDWRRVMEVNLFGAINGVVAAYPVMVGQGFGHIVNTASIEGLVPFPNTVGYVASKYGVVGLSNALRIEGRDLGVRVSVVCPGYIRTAIFQDSKMIRMDRSKVVEMLAEAGGMSPEECAAAILRGVERNRAVIVVTRTARALWFLQRISPGLVRRFMEGRLRRFRKEARTGT
jgi:NAD(P)-dependent dehydrogenase (short-subunit alcohol dehydrogenase family)